MKKLILISTAIIFMYSTHVEAQIVNIQDANFKAVLVNNTAINTNLDTEIQVSEALAIGYLDVSASNISDLTGISSFANLMVLQCQSNNLTSLDLSALPLLTTMYCNSNQITTLDASGNPDLTDFRCASNQLTYLDIRNGNNTSMGVFTAGTNPKLTCIDVDDSTYSANNWTFIDGTTHFSEDCTGTLGIDNKKLNDQLNVFPNPANEILNFELKNPTAISIINMIGEEVYQGNVNSNSTIDISEFSSGIYFIKDLNNGQTFKFIKK